MSADADPPRRPGRFWLFAPAAALALVCAGWAAAWFVIRDRVAEGLDAWLANETAAGRRWECPERAIAGFPFRIEVSCARLALEAPEGTLGAGRLRTVTQVYQPRLTVFELDGPLRASLGGVALEGSWDSLRGSFHSAPHGFARASLVVAGAKLRATGPMGDAALSARHAEAHARPGPDADAAVEVAVKAEGAAVPALDGLLGGTEPLDADLEARVTQARPLPRPSRQDVERWREAGGRIGLDRLTLAKGERRLEARGELALDELRRPAGRLDVAVLGLSDLLPALMTGRLPGAGGALGSAAGALGGFMGGRRTVPAPGAKPSPLPAIRLENGRILFGLAPVPGVRLMPLY
ncbi:MAG TPA: DUF2125 domain-containing protein [Beijerinckiaceae bacterium]|jgi:hypothetical protein